MAKSVAAVLFALSLAALEPVASGALGLGVGCSLALETVDVGGNFSGVSTDARLDTFPIGVKLFLDAKYLEASAGWLLAGNGNVTVGVGGYYAQGTLGQTLSYLTFAAYLKYPFNFRTSEIFPLLGLEYRLNIAALDSAGNDVTPGLTTQQRADLNELWFQAGGGMDFFFGNLSIRSELILGLKFLSPTDQDGLIALQGAGYSSP